MGHRVEEKEVNEYYLKVTTELAEKFGAKNLGKRVVPHLTLKPPFETKNIEEFERIIFNLAKKQKVSSFILDEFGIFPGNHGVTVFLKVKDNQEIQKQAESIVKSVRDFGENKNDLPEQLKLHLSIARYLKPEKQKEVWQYLHGQPIPKFKCLFNNLTIFENWQEGWKIHRTFLFR